MIVPDSIEPVVAWRVWDFGIDEFDHPLLISKNRTFWEPKKRMVADCPNANTRHDYVHGWQIRNLRGETHWIRDLDDPLPSMIRAMSSHATSCVATHLTGAQGMIPMPVLEDPKPPSIELLPGWEWELSFRAVDIPPDHIEIPGKSCSCGIYACKTLRDVRSQTHGDFYGEVYLWGRIEEGLRGYRAQYAYPKSLHLEKHSISGVEDLAKMRSLYGLEVDEATIPDRPAMQRSLFRRMIWWA